MRNCHFTVAQQGDMEGSHSELQGGGDRILSGPVETLSFNCENIPFISWDSMVFVITGNVLLFLKGTDESSQPVKGKFSFPVQVVGMELGLSLFWCDLAPVISPADIVGYASSVPKLWS
jgi:hypothetical protein